jgi:hypothetical protein
LHQLACRESMAPIMNAPMSMTLATVKWRELALRRGRKGQRSLRRSD